MNHANIQEIYFAQNVHKQLFIQIRESGKASSKFAENQTRYCFGIKEYNKFFLKLRSNVTNQYRLYVVKILIQQSNQLFYILPDV